MNLTVIWKALANGVNLETGERLSLIFGDACPLINSSSQLEKMRLIAAEKLFSQT